MFEEAREWKHAKKSGKQKKLMNSKNWGKYKQKNNIFQVSKKIFS